MRCHDRAAVESKHSIRHEESLPIQCLTVCCCSPCALSQELREIAQASSGATKDMNVFTAIAARTPDAGTLGESIGVAIQVATGSVEKAKAAAKL